MPAEGEFHVGEDLSYYLGPDAKCATKEQCAELSRRFAVARAAALKDERGGRDGT